MADYDPMTLLSKPMDDIKPPAPIPVGSYVAVGPDYVFDKTKPKDSSKKPSDLVNVSVVLMEAFPDVNAEELSSFIEDKGPLNEIEVRPLNFFLTPDALFRLKEFLQDHCKITDNEASNPAEALEVLKSGRQFGVEIGLVPNAKDPTKPYHQIVRTFALPDN